MVKLTGHFNYGKFNICTHKNSANGLQILVHNTTTGEPIFTNWVSFKSFVQRIRLFQKLTSLIIIIGTHDGSWSSLYFF